MTITPEDIRKIKEDFAEREKKDLIIMDWTLKYPSQMDHEYFEDTGKDFRIEFRILNELIEMLIVKGSTSVSSKC